VMTRTQCLTTYLNLDHILTNIERLMLNRAMIGTAARGGISHVEGRVGCWSNTAERQFGWDIGTVVCTHDLHDEPRYMNRVRADVVWDKPCHGLDHVSHTAASRCPLLQASTTSATTSTLRNPT
jgi:hypothetical protein